MTRTRAVHLPTATPMSGLLLRSELVRGFPALLVDGFATPRQDASARVTIARRDQLAPDVLLVMFDARVRHVELHLPPQVLHYGFEPAGSGYVRRRGAQLTDVPMHGDPAGGAVDVSELAAALSVAANAAELAAELIDTVPVIGFETGAPT